MKTPCEIRKLGGAIFTDFRYGNVFVYHNGAENVACAHFSLSVPKEGSSNEWLEPVTDEEYNKLK